MTRRTKAAKSNRTRAYSYLRFSTPEQMRGDSFRRQTAMAREYAERHGLDLDDKLTFQDLGKSAFRGANVAAGGALAAFVEAVDSGRVEAGSYLLVESLDRLSRDKIMSALNRFSALLEKGVTIVTLSDSKVYTAESLNNLPDLMLSLLIMSRAHEESETKSKRIRAAWQNKKERAASDGHVLTRRAPAWLRVRHDKFEPIAERAAIVRRIFEMTAAGIGKANIARTFNEEGVDVFGDADGKRRGDGWYQSYIRKILDNEAVIGRFQPMRHVYEDGKRRRVPDGEAIEGYYPQIVTPAEFYTLKHRDAPPSGKGKSPPRNILSGIAFCASCGGSMHYVNKGQPPKGGAYLACDNSRRKGTCNAPSVRYDPVADYVLGNLADYQNIWAKRVKAGPEIGAEIEAVAAQIAETQGARERLIDTLERVPSEAVERRLGEHEKRLRELKAHQKELRERSAIAGDDDGPRWAHSLIHFDEPGTREAAFAHNAVEIRRAIAKVIVAKGQPVRVELKAAP